MALTNLPCDKDLASLLISLFCTILLLTVTVVVRSCKNRKMRRALQILNYLRSAMLGLWGKGMLQRLKAKEGELTLKCH